MRTMRHDRSHSATVRLSYVTDLNQTHKPGRFRAPGQVIRKSMAMMDDRSIQAPWVLLVALVAAASIALAEIATGVVDPNQWHGQVVTLSEVHPRAYLYQNFLSPEECDHLIEMAKPHLKKSTVVNATTGEYFESKDRTSSNTFLDLGQDEVLARIENRISSVTHIPKSHGEPTQILEYVNGQKYNAHFDFLEDSVNAARIRGGHRLATFLMYLSTVPESGGGETCFPKAQNGQVSGEGWSECAQGKLAVKPRKGDALMFYNAHLDATKDNYALHEACPTTEGVKYSATKWLRIYPTGGGCFNAHESCQMWADRGECEANPSYMSTDCKKACKICEPGTIPVDY